MRETFVFSFQGANAPVKKRSTNERCVERPIFDLSGDNGEEVTPVPIPNTEVKLFSADGNWGLPPVRVGRCRAMEGAGT